MITYTVQNILYLICICIVFAFVWHIIMNSQRHVYEDLFDENKENLTMKENKIIITVEGYNNQRTTYIIPPDARVESMLEIDGSTLNITNVHIDVSGNDILIEKEDI